MDNSFLLPQIKGHNYHPSSMSLLHLSPSVSSFTALSRNMSKSGLQGASSSSTSHSIKKGDEYALAKRILNNYSSSIQMMTSSYKSLPKPTQDDSSYSEFQDTLVAVAKEMRQLSSIKDYLKEQSPQRNKLKSDQSAPLLMHLHCSKMSLPSP